MKGISLVISPQCFVSCILQHPSNLARVVSPPERINESIMSSGCLIVPFVFPSIRPFVRPFVWIDILLLRYLINALNNFDKTDQEYSLAPTDDLIRFWRLKVKGQGHSSRRSGEDIHVDAGSSKSICSLGQLTWNAIVSVIDALTPRNAGWTHVDVVLHCAGNEVLASQSDTHSRQPQVVQLRHRQSLGAQGHRLRCQGRLRALSNYTGSRR